jgi:hypothetical protein
VSAAELDTRDVGRDVTITRGRRTVTGRLDRIERFDRVVRLYLARPTLTGETVNYVLLPDEYPVAVA